MIAYGVDDLPAFWSRTSGLKAPLRLDTPEAIAALVKAKRALGLEGGVLVANPVGEADEIAGHEIAVHLETAVADARARGISAKAVTPFILSRMVELTAGKSLRTNIALIRNNAALAARVAIALTRP